MSLIVWQFQTIGLIIIMTFWDLACLLRWAIQGPVALLLVCLQIMPPLSEIANFRTKYFILSKVYTDEGGIK